MRWLIFFLLVLNVLTFSWFMFQGNQKSQLSEMEKNQQHDFAKIPPLKLLSELPASEIKNRDVRGNQSVPQSNSTDPVSLEPDSVGESDVVIDILPATDLVETQCALIGSFPEMVSAKQAKARIAKLGISSDVVLVLKQLPAINWVYIEPQNSRKEALAILKRLQEDGIDSFLIADGEYENGISLGFFSKLESAGSMMKERRRQGYEVSITRKSRDQKTYWVAFNEKNSSRVDEDLLDDVRGDVTDLKKQEKSCREVALLQIIE